jgi:hypothetical protein
MAKMYKDVRTRPKVDTLPSGLLDGVSERKRPHKERRQLHHLLTGYSEPCYRLRGSKLSVRPRPQSPTYLTIHLRSDDGQQRIFA